MAVERNRSNVVSVGDEEPRFDGIHFAQNASPFVDLQAESGSANAFERSSSVHAKVRARKIVALVDVWSRMRGEGSEEGQRTSRDRVSSENFSRKFLGRRGNTKAASTMFKGKMGNAATSLSQESKIQDPK